MELLTLLAGWRRTRLVDGAELVPASGEPRGRITLTARVVPVPRLRQLFVARLGAGVVPGPLERLVTVEGEHAGLASAPRGDGELTLGLVVGEQHAALVAAEADDAAGAPGIRNLARELLRHVSLGLGESRRRWFTYRAPPGWIALEGVHATRWLHPDQPRRPHTLTVMHARPLGLTAPALLERLLHGDSMRGLLLEPPAPLVPFRSRAGLAGAVARIAGRAGEGAPFVACLRATLEDDRFSYQVELEGPAATIDESLPVFSSLLDSIEPVPRPLMTPIADDVIVWSD